MATPNRDKPKRKKEIHKFKSNKDYYYKYGIPYKRCYYLYGLPGTGKTSIIKIIGKHYDLDIHSFSYNDFKHTDIINELPHKDCVVLIDEFYTQSYDKEKYFNLLQYIDGIYENHNILIFICSNDDKQHLDEQNKPLFRAGRIDVISYFGYVSIEQLKNMIKFYYDEEIDINYKIKNIFPSEITEYFLKGFAYKDILSNIIENEPENENEKEKENKNEKKINEENILKKRLSENEKIAAMTEEDRELYFKRKEINFQLNLNKKKSIISRIHCCSDLTVKNEIK